MILRALIAALGLMLLVSGYLGVRLKLVKAERDSAMSASALCAQINGSQTEAIKQLTVRNSELVSKNAADLVAAQAAAGRYLELEAQYDSLNAENEALRDEMERADPSLSAWMSSGMHRSAACSLWPKAAPCKN